MPNEAIIETGGKQIVYVQQRRRRLRAAGDPDRRAGRAVHAGARAGSNDGDQVVTFGSFFIDAEYKLKGPVDRARDDHRHHRARHPVPLARLVRWSRCWRALSVYALRTAPLDAIPDISDPQIIVYAKWPRSPQLLETEVTEPLIRALVGLARHSSRSAAPRTWGTRSST